MTEFRSIPQHLVMAEQVPFGQRYTYGSAHPMNAMTAKGYFDRERSRLRPGDTIRIVQLEKNSVNGRDNRVLAYVDSIVVEVGEGVRIELEGDVRKFEHKDIPSSGATDMSDEAFVGEDCEVSHDAGPWFHVVGTKSGKVYSKVRGKEAAQAVARGDAPIPPKAA